MREFVVSEEDFSLKFIEKVPEPQKGECFLLYQEGAGVGKSRIISHGEKYSATAIRHEHYNKKVTFALQKKDIQQKYRIVMADADFFFNADVCISYEIQDVQKYFFGNRMEEDTLYNITRKCVNGQNGKWRLKEGWELQNVLENEVERKVKQFEGVRFWVIVDVRADEAAQEILVSDQKTAVEIHTSGNEKDARIAANEHRAAIAESERTLKLKQIEEMGMLIKDFGVLGPVVNEYLEGKLDGVELYDYIMKARTDDMNMLNIAVTNDLLTTEEFMDRVNDILTNRRFGNIDNQRLPGRDRNGLEMHTNKDIEDEVEKEETEAPSDGSFL